MPITHLFVSAKSDSTDPTLVQPSNWNDEHVVNIFVDAETPAGSIDGDNRIFTLATEPNPASSLQLFRNGLLQYPIDSYILVGNTITFTYDNIPRTGDTLRAYYRKV